jgi:hypothetical protein
MATPAADSPTGDTSRLADRLTAARRRRFVGRTGELDLFRAALRGAEPPFAVLYVFGPGGIGKTALLGAFAAVATEEGRVALGLDLRTVEPSPPGFLAGLAAALGVADGASPLETLRAAGRAVLLLDTYEAAAALDPWLRERFLPQLPAGVLVVIAGRDPPASEWLADPGWHELLRVVPLRNLDPRDAMAYLRGAGLPAPLQQRVFAATHGHPLALALVAELLTQRAGLSDAGSRFELPDTPDLVRLLLERFVQTVPGPRHRQALEVCAHSRFTTEDLLRDALGGTDAGELFAWLRRLSFVEEGALGLFPHDLARDVLDADLRWRDPQGYAALHRRVRAHIVRRAQGSAGPDQQRACTDILFLHRTNPRVRPFLDWAGFGQAYADVLRPADGATILALTERHEGAASRAIVAHWLERQPEAFQVFRTARGETIGFDALLALHLAGDDDRAADPGTRAMWAYVSRHGAPAPGEEVLAFRFLIDRDAYQGPSPSFNLWAARGIQHIVTARRLAWSLVGGLADADALAPMFADIDYHRAVEADYEVGGRRYGVFAHDFRRVPPEAWLALTAQREIAPGAEPPPTWTPSPVLALSQPEFADAVRQALRDLRRPDRLARNPLRRARLARDRAGDDPPGEVLAQLVAEAAAALRAHPRDEKLYRALDRTYLRPAETQERAAEVLGLPFSTYRRHLTRGIERVVSWLWERELYGTSGGAGRAEGAAPGALLTHHEQKVSRERSGG